MAPASLRGTNRFPPTPSTPGTPRARARAPRGRSFRRCESRARCSRGAPVARGGRCTWEAGDLRAGRDWCFSAPIWVPKGGNGDGGRKNHMAPQHGDNMKVSRHHEQQTGQITLQAWRIWAISQHFSKAAHEQRLQCFPSLLCNILQHIIVYGNMGECS